MTFRAASAVAWALTDPSGPSVRSRHSSHIQCCACLHTTPMRLTWAVFHLVQGEEEHIFEKSEVNFWAEPLVFVKSLCKQVFHLLCQSGCQSSHSQLSHLQSIASEQHRLSSQLFRELPLSAEFLKTVEYTRLRIQEERTLAVLRLLACLEGKEVPRAEDCPREWRQEMAPRTEAAC